MGYSIAYNSGTTTPFGTFKQGPITMGLKPDEYTVSSGFTWYANAEYLNDAYLIISDTYSQGWSTQSEAKPTIWRSETGTTESFVSLVNQLPDVNGVTGFTDSGSAMGYLQSTGKYFVSKDNYLGIVTDGLVLNLDAGWYPSYSGSGTTWKDLSDNGNNGTLINGPTFSSNNGGILDFDGTDDKVLLFSNNNFPTSYTKFCFFKLKNRNNFYNLMSASSPVDHVLWVGTYASGVYRLAGCNNARSNYSEVIISDEIYDNIWYSAAISFDSNTLQMKLYLNGVLGSTTTSTAISSGGICKIGEHSSGQSIAGYVPISMVYDRALTDAEVLQNFNAQKGRFGL